MLIIEIETEMLLLRRYFCVCVSILHLGGEEITAVFNYSTNHISKWKKKKSLASHEFSYRNEVNSALIYVRNIKWNEQQNKIKNDW